MITELIFLNESQRELENTFLEAYLGILSTLYNSEPLNDLILYARDKFAEAVGIPLSEVSTMHNYNGNVSSIWIAGLDLNGDARSVVKYKTEESTKNWAYMNGLSFLSIVGGKYVLPENPYQFLYDVFNAEFWVTGYEVFWIDGIRKFGMIYSPIGRLGDVFKLPVASCVDFDLNELARLTRMQNDTMGSIRPIYNSFALTEQTRLADAQKENDRLLIDAKMMAVTTIQNVENTTATILQSTKNTSVILTMQSLSLIGVYG